MLGGSDSGAGRNPSLFEGRDESELDPADIELTALYRGFEGKRAVVEHLYTAPTHGEPYVGDDPLPLAPPFLGTELETETEIG